jgi:hypothetical protein
MPQASGTSDCCAASECDARKRRGPQAWELGQEPLRDRAAGEKIEALARHDQFNNVQRQLKGLRSGGQLALNFPRFLSGGRVTKMLIMAVLGVRPRRLAGFRINRRHALRSALEPVNRADPEAHFSCHLPDTDALCEFAPCQLHLVGFGTRAPELPSCVRCLSC